MTVGGALTHTIRESAISVRGFLNFDVFMYALVSILGESEALELCAEGGSVGDIFCVDNDIELMNVQIV